MVELATAAVEAVRARSGTDADCVAAVRDAVALAAIANDRTSRQASDAARTALVAEGTLPGALQIRAVAAVARRECQRNSSAPSFLTGVA